MLLLLGAHVRVPTGLASYVEDTSAQAHTCVQKFFQGSLLCTHVFACQGMRMGKYYHVCTWCVSVCVHAFPGRACWHAVSIELVCVFTRGFMCFARLRVDVCLRAGVSTCIFASLLMKPIFLSECSCGCVGCMPRPRGGQIWVFVCVQEGRGDERPPVWGVNMGQWHACTWASA